MDIRRKIAKKKLKETVQNFVDTYNKMQVGEIPFNQETIDEFDKNIAFQYLESIGYTYEYEYEVGDFIYKK